MEQLVVVVEKLNKRNSIPTTFADKTSIVGVVNKGFQFLGQEVTNVPNGAPGKWYTDRDGYFYWGSGLSPMAPEGPAVVVAAPAVVAPGAQPAVVAVADTVADTEADAAPLAPAAAIPTFTWFTNLGITDIWQNFSKGAGVTVAVLDTGYDINNSDLSPAVAGVTNLDGSTPALVFGQTNNPLINDGVGHGTFCGGTISNRNTKFQVGVAPESRLLVAKLSKDGSLDPTGVEVILDGIEWAINNQAEVISISMGKLPSELPPTPGYLDGLQTRLNTILAGRQVLVFAACGDNPIDQVFNSEIYPASFSGCVSVGSTDSGELAQVTMLSDKTIIHAQGVSVEGYFGSLTPTPQTGTSMSTPIVTGVAALAVSYLKAKNGSWNAATLLQDIYATADPITGSATRKLLNPANLFGKLKTS
jgi:subtilisin family serine protease